MVVNRLCKHTRAACSICNLTRCEELSKKPGRMWSAPKESSIQLSKSHYPTPVMEFADIDDNYGDLCDDKTKISPT